MAPLQFRFPLALLSTFVVIRLTSAQFAPFSRLGLVLDRSDPFGSDDSSGQLDTVVCGMRCEDNCNRKFLLTPVTSDATPQLRGARIQGATIGNGRANVHRCGQSQLMSEVRCSRNCAAMTGFCRRVARNLKINTNLRKRVRVNKKPLAPPRVGARRISAVETSTEGGRGAGRVVRQFADESRECDDTYYLWGMECIGADCEEIFLICVLVLVDNGAPALQPGGSGAGLGRGSPLCRNLLNPGFYTERSGRFGPGDISEVVPGPVCGVSCSGKNCEQKQLVYVGGVDILGSVEYWTDWFTSGDGRGCPESMVVSQMECDGPYCRWIRLGCQSVGSDIEMGDITYYSDPGGSGVMWCSGNQYLTGMSCLGRNCQRIDLWCNELQCA